MTGARLGTLLLVVVVVAPASRPILRATAEPQDDPATSDRVRAWSHDLDFMRHRMEEVHFDLYANVSRETWTGEVERLKHHVASISDAAVTVRIQELLARVGDGHTMTVHGYMITLDGWDEEASRELCSMAPIPISRLPLELHPFSDGLFVRAAGEQARPLLGKRVTRIADMPISDALARAKTICSGDNEVRKEFMAPRYLVVPEVLQTLGVSEGLDNVSVTVDDGEGRETTRNVPAGPFCEERRFEDMSRSSSLPLPLWRRHPDRKYWFEFDERRKLVYCQYNQVRDDPDEEISRFFKRLFRLIDERGAEYLVVDMRLNHGGDSNLNRSLVARVKASKTINRTGRFFAMIGPQTFSAAVNCAVDLERNTEVLFVGEPIGATPNFVGENHWITLPNSKLVVNGSSRYHQHSRPDDDRPWIAPHLPAGMSSQDYRENRDPAMQKIYEYIESPPNSGKQPNNRGS